MDSKMDLAKEVISAAEALELSEDKEVKVIDLLIKWYNKGFLQQFHRPVCIVLCR